MVVVVIAWWGAPIGALALLPFGLWASLIGAVMAGLLSRWRWMRWHDKLRDDRVIQRAFFRLLGCACKASGAVQPEHIQATRGLMQAWDLSLSDQDSAVKAFNVGKSGIDYRSVLARLAARCDSRMLRWMLAVWIAWVTRAAYQSLQAEALVGEILKGLGLPAGALRLKRNPPPRPQPVSVQPQPLSPWTVLGVAPGTRGPVLKKAYRKAMGSVHPDKVAAAGGDDSQIEAAKIKAQAIQDAWAKVKHHAGR